jgi:electron transport complex protein RnfD
MAAIYLTPHPHISAGLTTRRIMLTVVASLVPASIAGVVAFGIPALVTIVVSVVAATVFEWAFRKIAKLPGRAADCSAAVTGLLLALVCPPGIPLWMLVLGDLFAIVVAKEFFGGLGANVFNPALSGRAMLVFSFPVVMATYPEPGFVVSAVDAVSGATVLGDVYGGSGAPDWVAGLVNLTGGCIGEASTAAILVGAVILLVTRTIDWRAPVAMVAATAVLSAAAGVDPGMAVVSGGLLFGAVFMVTDYATAPITKGGRVLFGLGCGVITFLIRDFGSFPEGVMFSILIMNCLVPFLNTVIPRKYGFVKTSAAAAKGGK